MKKMKHFYGVSLLTAVCLAACTPENEFIRSNGNLKSLAFAVSTSNDQSTSTRSGEESYVVDTFVLGNDTLSLVCTVTDLDTPAPEVQDSPVTRGTPIYTRKDGTNSLYNLQTIYGNFNVSGYIVKGEGASSTLEPFYFNKTSDDRKSTIMGENDPEDTYENIKYVFDGETDGYEIESGSKTGWEYWHPADGTGADDFYWWKDAHHADKNYKLAFYAYAPTSTVEKGIATWKNGTKEALDKTNFFPQGKIIFEYTVPKALSGYSNRDAEVQPDILVGATEPKLRDQLDKQTINSTEHYIVPLKFFHALCGVNFKADKKLAENESGLVIHSVTLSGFKNSGKCTFTLGTPTTGKSENKISWDFTGYDGHDGTYTQTFSYEVPTSSDFKDDKITDKDATIYGPMEGDYASGNYASKNFMLIPQTYGTGGDAPDAKISINYTYNGETKTKTTSFAGTSYTWYAGKLYTYSIKKIADDIDVDIVETFDPTTKTKSNVTVKNTGTSNAYVRAAVIANWVDENGIIVAPCEPTFTPGTNWIEGSDGFYYYKNIILGGHIPANYLIGSYTAGTSPVKGAHLEMSVIGQGIKAGTGTSTDRSNVAGVWKGISEGDLTSTKE